MPIPVDSPVQPHLRLSGRLQWVPGEGQRWPGVTLEGQVDLEGLPIVMWWCKQNNHVSLCFGVLCQIQHFIFQHSSIALYGLVHIDPIPLCDPILFGDNKVTTLGYKRKKFIWETPCFVSIKNKVKGWILYALIFVLDKCLKVQHTPLFFFFFWNVSTLIFW